MKAKLILTAILLVTSASHAKTTCTVNAANPRQQGVYDQTLFSGEVTKEIRYLLIDRAGHSGREIKFEQIDTYAKWQAINGQTIVIMGQQDDGDYSVATTHVDVSLDKNMLPVDAMTVGPVVGNQFLSLVLPSKKLTIFCGQY